MPGESPWTEEPGRLQSIGLQRVGHDWSDLAHMHSEWYNHCGNHTGKQVGLLPNLLLLILLFVCVPFYFFYFCHQVMCDSFANPWIVAFQALLSMEFSRQEYWSGLPFPSPGNLPNPGIKHASLALGRFFTTEPLGNTYVCINSSINLKSSLGPGHFIPYVTLTTGTNWFTCT